MNTLFFSLLGILLSSAAMGTEFHMSLEEARSQGYTPVTKLKINFKTNTNITPHQHDWPFEKPYSRGFLGNNFVQYQPYSPPGYHLGTDMVLERDSWLIAPFDGKLEAGGYTYTDLPDGSRIKHWKPWPEGGGASFEVAIIDKAGYRFEFHHVEKNSLPPDIVNILNSSKPEIKKGQKLGRVYRWNFGPTFYDHIHVNIHGPDGVDYNPEFFFKLIQDKQAPDVEIITESDHIIVVGGDKKERNSLFTQAPLFYSLSFSEGDTTILDFRKHLLDAEKKFININNVYPPIIELPDGSSTGQMNDYYPFKARFFIKVPFPKNIGNGNFKIDVSDIAGNVRSISGKIP